MEVHYLDETQMLYKNAALEPDLGLCCTTNLIWQLPDLMVPAKMLEMNYGCGSTVHPRDLANQPKILYVGIGGGMELLQFSYFNRNKGAVIGLDSVDEMLLACKENILEAQKLNSWFESDFIELVKGNALHLNVNDSSIDVAAQNCLFNIFNSDDLDKALKEMYRVLKPHGRLVLSDPICDQEMPLNIKNDNRLRAACLSGAIPLDEYLNRLVNIGFGTIEVRAKRPYRILSSNKFETLDNISIESVEICAIKDPVPDDGPCIFTGRTAIYFGEDNCFDDKKGHVLYENQPLLICDKTANQLASLKRDDLYISPTTWNYDGGGCC